MNLRAWSMRRRIFCRCAALLGFIAAAVSSPAHGQTWLVGEWGPPLGGTGPDGNGWPLEAVHAAHLPTGRILVWRIGSGARLWNPANGFFSDAENNFHDVASSGHAALADGSLLAAGGAIATSQTSIFELTGIGGWQVADDMTHRRWYPTCTTLPNGSVLAIAGRDIPAVGQPVVNPEIYNVNALVPGWDLPLGDQPEDVSATYPFMFVLPDDGTGETKVFYAAGGTGGDPLVNSYILNIADGSWSSAIPSNFSGRLGSAVMYEPGKVLKCGGVGGPATDVIDLTVTDPVWQSDPSMDMVLPRFEHNLVLLPVGKILAVGGENMAGDVLPAEWFDPDPLVEIWEGLAAMTIPRAHHSTAVLLRDARVLACGDEASAEIFSPPYLFSLDGTLATRPVIGFAPMSISYGQNFKMTVIELGPEGETGIVRVTLLRLAAVTHSFDHNQRFVELQIVGQGGNRLTVRPPANANLAPPGYYMLFLISDAGVPSVAEYVLLE